ncbi:MAG TPA: hypothetical protein VFO25_08110 [Candidatus Eremiobacteraceae bacterium]|nr:hypothetical protein [Candidatus Eremiobacteraceae bacterium]
MTDSLSILLQQPLTISRTPAEGAEYIGRCIYCELTPPFYKLTREHGAPDGLMGKWELLAATCVTHQKLTSYIETKALEGPLHPARLHDKLYGSRFKRRYRREHPRGNPDDPVIEERFLLRDGTVETAEIPVSRHPYLLEMPRFDEGPQILADGRRWPLDYRPKFKYITSTKPETESRLCALLAEDRRRTCLLSRRDDENLMKMLAKIAYCFAIYLDVERFRPLILDYITSPRGDNSWGRYFIGGPQLRPDLVLPQERRHAIHVRKEIDLKNPRTQYVVGRLQLCNINFMPVYDVVLGVIL